MNTGEGAGQIPSYGKAEGTIQGPNALTLSSTILVPDLKLETRPVRKSIGISLCVISPCWL